MMKRIHHLSRWQKILLTIFLSLILLISIVAILSYKPVPEKITYGMSFNTFYARELGLDWQQTYDAILDELGVRHLRLAAHWPMIEPEQDLYNFTELDYQVRRAEAVGADIILATGRRLPRWPECHVPAWAASWSFEDQKQEILEQMKLVVERYKDSPAVLYWQVENEPYLSLFAQEHCGPLDEVFLEEQITMVRTLDPSRPVLITDSGNLGTWFGAYKNGDLFGTSVYVHFWNPELGQFRTLLPPWFYRVKEQVMAWRYGDKPTLLIELSAEPWLIAPITEVDVETQFSRMDIDKLEDILQYAAATRYDTQYLWGAEWWYWLIERGHPELWERGKELFVTK